MITLIPKDFLQATGQAVMDNTDIVSVIVALAGLMVIYLVVRGRESRAQSGRHNLIILAAIGLTLGILFALGGQQG